MEMIIITETITIMGTIITMEETKVKGARGKKDLKEARQRKEVMFTFHNNIPTPIPTAVILQTVRDQRVTRPRRVATITMIITTEMIIMVMIIIMGTITTMEETKVKVAKQGKEAKRRKVASLAMTIITKYNNFTRSYAYKHICM